MMSGWKGAQQVREQKNVLFLFFILVLLVLTACNHSPSDQAAVADEYRINHEKAWSYTELQQTIEQMLDQDEWHFVVRADDQKGQSAYYVGSRKGDRLELSGRFNGKDFWIKADHKLVIEAENLKKELSLEETGLISPADHFKFILLEITSAEKTNRLISIDNTYYDRWEVPLSRKTVQEKVESFLGPQFSDKMVVDQVIDHLTVNYILAVHPETKKVKQMQLTITINDGDEKKEQELYFRFYDPA